MEGPPGLLNCGEKGHKIRLCYTVEPSNKGHFRANSFVPCRDVVPIYLGGTIIH